jgi:hypothetical protein
MASVTSLHRLVCTVICTVWRVPVGRHHAGGPNSHDNHEKTADQLDAALCSFTLLTLELTL